MVIHRNLGLISVLAGRASVGIAPGQHDVGQGNVVMRYDGLSFPSFQETPGKNRFSTRANS
mgnify:CR=1